MEERSERQDEGGLTPPGVGHAPRDRRPVQAGGLQQVPDLAVAFLVCRPRDLWLRAGGRNECRRLSLNWVVHGIDVRLRTSETRQVDGGHAQGGLR